MPERNQEADNAGRNIDTGGGAYVNGSVNTQGGEFVGRDKILSQVNHIYQQTLSQVEEAEKSRSISERRLAEGVRDTAQNLRAKVLSPTQQGNTNPYRGLYSYELTDAGRFFGRDQAIIEFLRLIRNNRFCILHAQSGAGKSSLLQAGITPRLLADGALTIFLRAYNVSPTLAIKRVFLSDLNSFPELLDTSLRDFLRRVTRVIGRSTRLYIFLDQFEEFFTFLSPTAQADFVRDLAECIEDDELDVYWVFSMRSEYFSELANFRPRIRNPFGNDYRLNRLSRPEAQTVITAPAAQQNIEIESALVTAILDDLQGKTGEIDPPQLQLICSALYEGLQERLSQEPAHLLVITEGMYVEEGRAQGILGDYLNRVLQRNISREERPLARLLLVALVSSDKKRIRRSFSDLARELAGASKVDEVGLKSLLDFLVISRLLNVINDDTVDETCYELAHDYLLNEIEMTAEMKERKEAEEIITLGAAAYQRFKTLLSPAQLQLAERYKTHLVIDAIAAEMIAASEQAVYPRPGINLDHLDENKEHEARILERTKVLREYLQDRIPSRARNDNLLIATWALRDFGARRLLDETPYYLAEVISHFDIVAIQEVKNDLAPLMRVQELLGNRWEVVHSDIAPGAGGNNERFAFLFDTRKVQNSGFTGGLVIAPERGYRQPAIQPARVPYMAGFQVGKQKLTFVSVHIVFGNDPAERVVEVQQIAQALNVRSRREKNPLILLGDMQVDAPGSKILTALRKSGFHIPENIQSLGTFSASDKPYDQIAIFTGDEELGFELGQGGVVNHYDVVFTADDEGYYAEAMGEKYQNAEGHRSRFYLRDWRTWQMSDHLPKWLELKWKDAT